MSKKIVDVKDDNFVQDGKPIKVLTNRRNGGKRLQVVFTEPTRTHQSFQAECDINTIMAKYKKTGVIAHVNRYQGRYGDFFDVQGYHESLHQVLDAQEAFLSLPAALRARFQNDPGQFLDFVGNPANVDEMRSLGLLKPLVEQPISDPSGSDSSA